MLGLNDIRNDVAYPFKCPVKYTSLSAGFNIFCFGVVNLEHSQKYYLISQRSSFIVSAILNLD